MEFYVDPSRCIGCRACVAACAECDSHRGQSMIHVDYVDRATTIATVPMVCMHTSAQVGPTERDPAILVRRQDGSFVAYSQKCTHLACAVIYSAEHDRLECPCHVGYFSVETGRVLQGPPPRPLPRILLEERNGEILATGVDLQGEHR